MKPQNTLILLGLISLINVGEVFSQDSISVSIPDSILGLKDSEVIIPIIVGDLSNRGVISYDTRIVFDEDVLVANRADNGNTLTADFLVTSLIPINTDTIRVGGAGGIPLNGSGTLVNLIFDVVGDVGDTTDLLFVSFIFGSGDPPAVTQSGKFTVDIVDGVRDFATLPQDFVVTQNYPNPFNPETTISFNVPGNKHVTLKIYNIYGQEVHTLLDRVMTPGTHTVHWKGQNTSGEQVPSGLYFYKIESGRFLAVKKMLLVR